jgi:hypothetical protein
MEGSKISGPWNVPCLEVHGETSLLGTQWKVPSLVAFGMFYVWLPLEGKGEAFSSPPSIFHPIKFYLNLFSLDFMVLFYHGSKPLLHIFPSFSLTYKLQSCIFTYPIFHTFITKLNLIKYFFLSLN